MIFTAPMPFEEAVQKLGSKSPIASILNSEAWSRLPVWLRERAFFSSTIEDVRFLVRAQNFLQDTLNLTTEVTGEDTASPARTFKAGGRARFIEELQKFAIREGMGPLDKRDVGSIKDIRSESRLGLIFDTNMKSVRDFGYWKQGMDADVLDAFPSQRFIRVVPVRKPRPLHQANLGAVRRKDDLGFWIAMNSPSIGGFNVPWGPFGFNSGCDVEDVGRKESDVLGLTEPNEIIQPVDGKLNDQLQASTQNLRPPMVNLLKAAFGDQVEFTGNSVKWRGSEP